MISLLYTLCIVINIHVLLSLSYFGVSVHKKTSPFMIVPSSRSFKFCCCCCCCCYLLLYFMFLIHNEKESTVDSSFLNFGFLVSSVRWYLIYWQKPSRWCEDKDDDDLLHPNTMNEILLGNYQTLQVSVEVPAGRSQKFRNTLCGLDADDFLFRMYHPIKR